LGGEISPLGNQKEGATTCTHVFLGGKWLKSCHIVTIFKELPYFDHRFLLACRQF
jgi:hypothetical protein